MVELKLDEQNILKILRDMGPKCVICKNPLVCSVNGIHTCCPTYTNQEIFENRPIVKSMDGSLAFIRCLTKSEAENAAFTINNAYNKFGYSAKETNSFLTMHLPWHSTSSVLFEGGGRPLSCYDALGIENVTYTVPDEFTFNQIKKQFEKTKSLFKKEYNTSCEYPDNFSILNKNVILPSNTTDYDPRLIDYLISKNFTIAQTLTSVSLYQLVVKAHVDIYEMKKPDVIKIIHFHSGNPERTIEKQLFKDNSLDVMLNFECLGNMLEDVAHFFDRKEH